jgi:hypothetical protein
VPTFAADALRAVRLGAASRELLMMLTEYDRAERSWVAPVIEPVRKIMTKTAEEGNVVTKGFISQSFYLDLVLQHIGDVNLNFPTYAGSLGMVKWLRAERWEYDTLECPRIKWHESGQLYGQFSLALPDSSECLAQRLHDVAQYSSEPCRHRLRLPHRGRGVERRGDSRRGQGRVVGARSLTPCDLDGGACPADPVTRDRQAEHR